MFGSATKYFAGLGLLLIVAATAYGVGTAVNGNGDIAFSGTVILGTAGCAALFMAWLSLEAGDAPSVDRDRENSYQLVPAYWPLMVAVGMGILIVGLASDPRLTVLGVALLGVGSVRVDLHCMGRPSLHRCCRQLRRATQVRPAVRGSHLGGALRQRCRSRSSHGYFWHCLATAPAGPHSAVSTVVLVVVFFMYFKPDLKTPVIAGIMTCGCARRGRQRHRRHGQRHS